MANCGVSTEMFLELLSFYLGSTFIWVGLKVFGQKSAVCIGFRVAPGSSNIYVNPMNQGMAEDIADHANKVFYYVDDFLIFLKLVSPRVVPHVVKSLWKGAMA